MGVFLRFCCIIKYKGVLVEERKGTQANHVNVNGGLGIFIPFQSKCEKKIANTYRNKNTPHTQTQTSELGGYNKLSLWLSLKMQLA